MQLRPELQNEIREAVLLLLLCKHFGTFGAPDQPLLRERNSQTMRASACHTESWNPYPASDCGLGLASEGKLEGFIPGAYRGDT
eukprot:1821483-Rhodomonas_salina.2